VDYFSTVHEEVQKQLGFSGAEKLFLKSIFVVVIGGNDILGYFRSSDLRNKIVPQQYVASMVLTLKAKLKVISSYK
jgi:hypothetical protein